MEKDVIISITDELYHLTLLFPKKEPLKYKMREQANAILEAFAYYFKERKNNFQNKSGLREMVNQAQKSLDALDCNFEIVKRQNWVSLLKVLLLKGRYLELKRLVEEIDLFEPAKLAERPTLLTERSAPLVERSVSEAEEIITNTKPLLLEQKEAPKEPAKLAERPTPLTEWTASLVERPIEPTKVNDRQKTILSILKSKEKAQVWEFKATFPDVSKRTLRRDFEYLFNQGMVKRVGEKNNTFYRL
ncbi:MAG: DeoR family transcriptional regulator [bacterium]